MFKRLLAIAFGALLLAGCSSSPPTTYTVTQYRGDGVVQSTWKVSKYWAAGQCVSFNLVGEPTRAKFYACGDVVAQSDAPAPDKPSSSATHTITQFARDGRTAINTWDATSVSSSNGCITFYANGDGTQRIVCGNVLAEAKNNTEPNVNSPAPYRVAFYAADGTPVRQWRVSSFNRNGGSVFSFYVAGVPNARLNYVTGFVQAGVQPQ